jgi:uncharacterized protein YprB with RNaseH-like and TPR domain
MQFETQRFLDLVEQNHSLVFFDIEATGLKGDYNSALVASFKPYGQAPFTLVCDAPGDDEELAKGIRETLAKCDCVVTYYGKGFDFPMINTRLLNWKIDPINPVHHIDLYFTLRSKLLTGRRSQGHLLEWLKTPEKKMSVSADDWNKVLDPKTHDAAIKTMVKRCESDVRGLEALYKRTRHLISDIRKG